MKIRILGSALTTLALALTVSACSSSKTGTASSQPAGPTSSDSTAVTTATTQSASSAANTASTGATAPSGLIKSGHLTVCIDPEYAPLEYVDNGKTVGFDADGARALGSYWGVTTTFAITTFQGLVPGLKAKRCDIMWSGLYVSPERLAVTDAVGVLNTGPGLIVNASEKNTIKTKDDLAGKTVAVQAGGSNEKIIRALSAQLKKSGKSPINVQSYPQTAPTVAAVTNGKADALIETDVALPGMVQKSAGQLVVVPNVFDASATTFGVFSNKGSPLSAALKSAITTLVSSGKLGTIAKKYGLDPAKVRAS